jgi:hypothetical protein
MSPPLRKKAGIGLFLITRVPSADFCLITYQVPSIRAIGFHLFRSFQLMSQKSQGSYKPMPDWLSYRSLVKQISPDKDMYFLCTATSFTVAIRSRGFVVLCQLTSSLRLI